MTSSSGTFGEVIDAVNLSVIQQRTPFVPRRKCFGGVALRVYQGASASRCFSQGCYCICHIEKAPKHEVEVDRKSWKSGSTLALVEMKMAFYRSGIDRVHGRNIEHCSNLSPELYPILRPVNPNTAIECADHDSRSNRTLWQILRKGGNRLVVGTSESFAQPSFNLISLIQALTAPCGLASVQNFPLGAFTTPLIPLLSKAGYAPIPCGNVLSCAIPKELVKNLSRQIPWQNFNVWARLHTWLRGLGARLGQGLVWKEPRDVYYCSL